MMEKLKNRDYIIVVGGYNYTEFDISQRLLKLSCNDFYEGLPEKVYKMFRFLNNDERFSAYTHFIKLDRDVIIKSLIEFDDIKKITYAGVVHFTFNVKRENHIGRCSKSSYYNYSPYSGYYVPWCIGPHYIISKEALQIIVENGNNYKSEIYEDVFIAKLLYEQKTFPTDISCYLSAHLYSEEHSFTRLQLFIHKIKVFLLSIIKYCYFSLYNKLVYRKNIA